MADLRETLEQRERQSKLVSFLIGSAVIMAIIVGVVWFNNRNDNSGQVVDEGASITATETDDSAIEEPANNNQEAVAGESTNTEADEATDNSAATAVDDNDEAEATGDSAAVTSTQTSEDELPNTGPEQAILGLVVIAVTAKLLVQARSKLEAGLTS